MILNPLNIIVPTDSENKNHLIIAVGNTLFDYYHELLGRPRLTSSVTSDDIIAMTYDSLDSTYKRYNNF